MPLRLAIGRRGLADRAVEWKRRAGGEVEMVPLADLPERLRAIIDEQGPSGMPR